MRKYLPLFCLFLSQFFVLEIHAQRKPNVIFILADDLGYGDLSCLNPNSKTSTPNIDKMAREGKTFTDAHSPASLCTPTRYGIMTGKYGWRSSLKKGVLKHYDPPLIEEERYTIGKLLQDNKYATAAIGKWHLGWDWHLVNGSYFRDSLYKGNDGLKDRFRIEKFVDFSKPIENGPTTRGFDYYYGDDVPNYPPYCFFENNRLLGIPNILKPDSMYGHPGFMVKDWSLEDVVPSLTEKAVGYIKNKASMKQPFFLYFALTSPHVPIAPNKKFKGSSNAGAYGDFVQETDWAVSEIIKAVADAGIDENTIIIFTSDNGSPGQDGTQMSGAMNSVMRFGHYPNSPFRGMKTDLWEGGHHVPFIIRWPGKIKPNSISSTTICQTDLMATCADLLKINIPSGEAIDSYSILPLMLDAKKEKYKRPYTVHHSGEGIFGIRKDEWKLIMTGNSGGGLIPSKAESVNGLPVPIQLYNLKEDPEEKNNLYLRMPEKVNELKTLLAASKARGM
jgi:arylsulfatase A-like enzyme